MLTFKLANIFSGVPNKESIIPINCDIYSLGIILLKMASLDCYYSS